MVLGAKNFMAKGLENWHFSYTTAPAGKAWVALGSPSQWPWAAVEVGLADGGVIHCDVAG